MQGSGQPLFRSGYWLAKLGGWKAETLWRCIVDQSALSILNSLSDFAFFRLLGRSSRYLLQYVHGKAITHGYKTHSVMTTES